MFARIAILILIVSIVGCATTTQLTVRYTEPQTGVSVEAITVVR